MRPLPLREMHLAMGATMTEWADGEWCDIYGDTLAVRTSGGPVPIRVAEKGLYDPNNDRLRARPGQ